MPQAAYRLYFGDRPATSDELDWVEEIVVDQEMDMAWEARIRISFGLDENGFWQHPLDEFAPPFTRIRVELRIGDGAFAPLIDGPVAGYHNTLDSTPGKSTLGVVVRDDSVLLHREETVEVFENRTDDAIARELFGRFPAIGSTQIASAPGPAQPATVRRGTVIQFLRERARANGFHAYVLPGELPGQSVGCFLPDPTAPGALPPLVLLGSDRNLLDLTLTEHSESPELSRARALTLADQQIQSAEIGSQDLTLLRPLPAITDDQVALRLLPPEDNDREDPATRARAQSQRSSYAYQVSGRVIPGCYPLALAPYQKVSLRASNLPRVSGDYLLTKVTHRLSPSLYSQDFQATSDSRSDPGGSSPIPSVF